MADKKSIYEEALLDVQKIQEALNANTKEILRSVAREEIDGMVKESLEEEGLYEEEEVKDDESAPESDDQEDDASSDDKSEAEPEGDEEGGEETELDTDSDDAIETPEVGPEDDQEMGMDADDAFGGDEIDMTSASDDDVIAIYKKLSGEDEIEVVGDEVHVNISEPGEYIIKKNDLGIDDESETDFEDIAGEDEVTIGDESEDEEFEDKIAIGDESEDEEFEDEMMYEIAMDDEEMVKEESDEDEEMVKEEDTEEDEDVVEEKIAVGVGMSVGNHRNKTTGGAAENPKSVKESISSKKIISETEIKYKKLLTETAQLKAENDEFRKALKKFRNMLVETVVFNSNLSYVTKLFMEHSTTKDEKKEIIKRFDDEVTNLKESKRLYKTIANELVSRKPINESVESKIIKEVATSSSKQLNEATAYVDPSTQRIKDLIKRVENR